MNYVEVTKAYWTVSHDTAPRFFNHRIAALVKAGYLQHAGVEKGLIKYKVIGGNEEYQSGSDILTRSYQ